MPSLGEMAEIQGQGRVTMMQLYAMVEIICFQPAFHLHLIHI